MYVDVRSRKGHLGPLTMYPLIESPIEQEYPVKKLVVVADAKHSTYVTLQVCGDVPLHPAGDDDVVAQVFQKGYALKGILVRPARVSVYKNG